MPAAGVLIVDRSGSVLWALAARLRIDGIDVVETVDVDRARGLLTSHIGAVLVHLSVEGDLAPLLSAARALDPELAIFAFRAPGTPEVVDTRPFLDTFALPCDPEVVTRRLGRELAFSRARLRLRALRVAAGTRLVPEAIVGDSAAMVHVRRSAAKLAASAAVPVLLSGEPGTGRSLVASVLHDTSERGDRSLVRFDCSPRDRLASELLGSDDGGVGDGGVLTAAADTTLVLEAVDRLPLTLQAALAGRLRDARAATRGDTQRSGQGVRLIATTSANLADRVRDGLFRDDLYYALGVAHIILPPLRDRGRDVLQLAGHFAAVEGAHLHARDATLDEDAGEVLLEYGWPGNVRELRAAVRLALMRAPDGRLTREAMVRVTAPTSEPGDRAIRLPEAGVDLDALERQLVFEALERTGGNRTQAAQLLGLHRDQIRYRLRKYGRE